MTRNYSKAHLCFRISTSDTAIAVRCALGRNAITVMPVLNYSGQSPLQCGAARPSSQIIARLRRPASRISGGVAAASISNGPSEAIALDGVRREVSLPCFAACDGIVISVRTIWVGWKNGGIVS